MTEASLKVLRGDALLLLVVPPTDIVRPGAPDVNGSSLLSKRDVVLETALCFRLEGDMLGSAPWVEAGLRRLLEVVAVPWRGEGNGEPAPEGVIRCPAIHI